jgi:putative aldouronate transport system substrate-binding protein
MKKLKLFKLLAIAMTASLLLSACTSTKPSPSAPTASDSQKSSVPSGTLISDKPLTLTAHLHWGNVYALSDKWTIVNEAAKRTNISLKGTASEAESNSKQAFNLMIASKNIPDMVGGNRDDINKYGMEGAFAPLNDLIDKHAPNIKKYLDSNPDVKAAITAADGKIYQIPFVYRALVSEAWFIREDWLNKLNLKAPTTVDEMYNVLKAFTTQDPNGNGQKDEVGIFTRMGGATENKVLSVLSLFGVSDYWHTNKNGKVQLGLYTPEYKQAIKNVAKWYAEGLIDKEIFTRGGKSRDILYPENNGGVIHDWIPSTSGYNPKVSATVPGFKVVGILPPKDINGNQWEIAARDKLDGAGWAISNSNKNKVESMKYMDFWWTEEGVKLSTYGIEGDTYTMVDGKPKYTDKVLKASTPINDFMRKIGGQINDIGYPHDASYELQMMDSEGVKALELYEKSGVVNKMNVKLPALSFTEKELDLITSKYPTCRTYMLEQLQKWTFDGSKIDAEFDKYMSTLKSMGIEEIIATYQSAYDRLNKK